MITKLSLLESLLVGVSGLAAVFAVLVSLSLFIMLQSKVLKAFKIGRKEAPQKESEHVETVENQDSGITAGELKLIDVDEKTAAVIMAIVSHESQIPLSELQFKSIKALN